jgi:hypothetical protein
MLDAPSVGSHDEDRDPLRMGLPTAPGNRNALSLRGAVHLNEVAMIAEALGVLTDPGGADGSVGTGRAHALSCRCVLARSQ